jgi:hypothetical protein
MERQPSGRARQTRNLHPAETPQPLLLDVLPSKVFSSIHEKAAVPSFLTSQDLAEFEAAARLTNSSGYCLIIIIQ